MSINAKLNDYAQERAENLAMGGPVTQRTLIPYGENVYVEFSKSAHSKILAKRPVETWYRDGKYYKYGVAQPKNLKDVGNFTQLIWRQTNSLGIGMASDTDGKVYLVCSYDPAGNVEGEFAKNVLPPKEEKIELLPLEKTGIKYIEPRMDIVKSMERLYAVPSEKLRVWSIWLTKIGEIADEWQRWLRAHIDITIKLGDHLQAAKGTVESEKKVEDKSNDVFSEDTYTTANEEMEDSEEVGESLRDTNVADAEKTTVFTSESLDQKEINESDVGATSTNEDEPANENQEENNEARFESLEPEDTETMKSFAKSDDEPSPQDATNTTDNNPSEISVRSTDRGKREKKNEKESTTYVLEDDVSWPIGIPWKPLGCAIKKPHEMEIFPLLTLPRNEDEMLKFIKDFTHQTTIYRSYYKHWKETADLAIKEIGGRTVMSTFKVRGKVARGTSKRYNSRETADDSGVFKKKNVTSIKSGKRSKTSVRKPESTKKTVVEDEDVDPRIKDEARADEDIPYFFYLKAEPDIEIAIEHDDEEVILPDLDRECVYGDYKRLYFNLTDKPGKGGKPWL